MRDRCDLRVAAVSHISGRERRFGDAGRASRLPLVLDSGRRPVEESCGMRKRVIRAGEIEIEDSEGRVRARFGVSNEDLPFMSFYGADDKLRARFGVQPDGSAGLAIADDEGKVRATFGLFSDGSASMA